MDKKDDDKIKVIKKVSRELHKGMPQGGRHGTKKGDRGYTRKIKHKKSERSVREGAEA